MEKNIVFPFFGNTFPNALNVKDLTVQRFAPKTVGSRALFSLKRNPAKHLHTPPDLCFPTNHCSSVTCKVERVTKQVSRITSHVSRATTHESRSVSVIA